MKLLGLLLCGLAAALTIHLVTVLVAPPGPDPFQAVLRPVAAWLPSLVLGFVAALVLAGPRQLVGAPGRALAVVAIVAAFFWPAYALAQDAGGTTVNLGGIFSDLRGYIEMLLSLAIAAIVALAAATVRRTTGLSIDAKMRESLQSAAMNGVHFGLDKVQDAADRTSFDVKSKVIADGIGYVRSYAPLAVKHFKLGEADIEAIVRAKLGELLPAEAKAAVQAAPSA